MVEPAPNHCAETSFTDYFFEVLWLLGHFEPLLIDVHIVVLELNILVWLVLVVDKPLI